MTERTESFAPDVEAQARDTLAYLVGCSWVARRGSEARVDLQGPYGVYVISDAGLDAAS